MSRTRARRSWVVAGGVAAVVLFGQGLYQWAALSVRQRQMDRRLAQLAAERAQLAEEHQRLQSDSAYVEGLIRSTFKVSQPGEYVIPLDASSPKR